jgi:predicted dithiol-disulfide oxidoreductase (DUF899 family)
MSTSLEFGYSPSRGLVIERNGKDLNHHKIVNHEEWAAARDTLLTLEKEHTRRGDELANLRQNLPWVRIGKDYLFNTAAGPQTLADMFDGRSQLVVYSFMFGPDYQAGCPVCSSIADSFNGVLEHLRARDVTMICVSRAPLERLLAYRTRMGWNFPWASTEDSDFNFDFGRSVPKETVASWFTGGPPDVPAQLGAQCGTDAISYLSEVPGLSVFKLVDGDVYLTYSTTARGLEPVMVYYGILDRVPNGRNEGEPANPTWLRRHDEFAIAT